MYEKIASNGDFLLLEYRSAEREMMQMNIHEITEQYLAIQDVIAVINDDMIDAVIIILSNNHMMVMSVDVDTDELMLTNNELSINHQHRISILADLKGLTLIRSWVMRNHLGYQDAIQFELFDKQKAISKFVQFMIVASEIEYYQFEST